MDIGLMEKDNQSILQIARQISSKYNEISSLLLEPVIDSFNLLTVHPWRNNGSVFAHPLHRMMSRVGGFPPSLARYFIATYSKAGDVIFDPFCGKGTVLLEASQLGRIAIGGDVAPDAVIVSRAKGARVKIAQVANYIKNLKDNSCRSVKAVPLNIRLFFHPDTLRQIISIRRQLIKDMQSPRKGEVATFVCGIMLGILHGHSRLSLSLPCNQAFAMSPQYVRRYVDENGLQRPRRNVKKCLLEKSLEFLPMPNMAGSIHAYETSADNCKTYLKRKYGKVNLVLTSPPYLNRQTYTKDAWLRLWFLGRNSEDVLRRSLETGSVSKFKASMKKMLTTILDAVSPNGYAIFVCGEVKAWIKGRQEIVRVSDICLSLLHESKFYNGKFKIDSIIRDKKLMKRGSYFAVHAGKQSSDNGESVARFGEERILVLKAKK
ncbi:hypothetical protein HY605_03970 [Candidatus Peregrinibacteria bacterium]|nr:hypothetical protein [Candidatus Peregrinibacteria bacterium]